MRDQIIKYLDMIERQYDVKIIHACESGSRAWGYPSSDSDYDVRFIYAHKRNWYISIDNKKDAIDLPNEEIYDVDNILDIVGWDIKKALYLLRKSNAPLLEWLISPITYKQSRRKVKSFKKLSIEAFLPNKTYHHYLGTIEKHIKHGIDFSSSTMRLKSFFYIVRSMLAAKWVIRYHTQPPMTIHDLIDANLIDDGKVVKLIMDLIVLKSKANEHFRMDLPDVLKNFILNELQYIKFCKLRDLDPVDITKFDNVLHKCIP